MFNYIYAIFHSPTYRQRYAEFLKSDFPRVPLTSDVNLFRALCEKGAELVALHLLESPTLENPITGYPVKGSNVVEKGFPKYLAPGEPEPGTGKRTRKGPGVHQRCSADRLPVCGDRAGCSLLPPWKAAASRRSRKSALMERRYRANTSKASRPKSGISTSAAIRFARNGSKTGAAAP